jgi:hypothetical protein
MKVTEEKRAGSGFVIQWYRYRSAELDPSQTVTYLKHSFNCILLSSCCQDDSSFSHSLIGLFVPWSLSLIVGMVPVGNRTVQGQ